MTEGTRPALVALSIAAFLFVSLSLGYGFDDGDATLALGVATAGVAALSVPAFAMRTRRAFRWIVGAYAVFTVLAIIGPGLLLLPSVLCLAFAAMAPPPPPGWEAGFWLKALCLASVAAFAAGLGTLALIR